MQVQKNNYQIQIIRIKFKIKTNKHQTEINYHHKETRILPPTSPSDPCVAMTRHLVRYENQKPFKEIIFMKNKNMLTIHNLVL